MLEGEDEARCEVFEGIGVFFNRLNQRLQEDVEIVIGVGNQ